MKLTSENARRLLEIIECQREAAAMYRFARRNREAGLFHRATVDAHFAAIAHRQGRERYIALFGPVEDS